MRRFAALSLICVAALAACAEPVVQIAPRRALAVAALDGSIYATGGWNGEATQLNTVQVFDGRTVKPAPGLQIARSQHALVAADGAVFALGGWSAERGLITTTERLQPPDAAWREHGRLPTPRREPAAALLGRDIVVAGGFNGTHDGDPDGYSDVVESFNLDSMTWRTLAPLNGPRRGLAMVAFEGALYVFGGYNPGEKSHAGFLNIAERYDANSGKWVALPWQLAPRTWLAATVVEDHIVVAGGYDANGPLATVELVQPATGRVCQAGPLPRERAWLGIATLQNVPYAIGGETRAGFATMPEPVSTRCQP